MSLPVQRATVQNKFKDEREQLFAYHTTPLTVTVDNDYQLRTNIDNSLARSSQMVDNYLDAGEASLIELQSQRKSLERSQDKVGQMGAMLHFARSLMKMINRRQWEDKWIIYIGIFVTLFIFLFLLYWLKS